jgi:excisionase family DNA binding protein
MAEIERRFVTLDAVAEILCISRSQTYALVRSGDLVAIKLGGRGQWRVEISVLEAWIKSRYKQTKTWVDEHPYQLSSQLDDDIANPD